MSENPVREEASGERSTAKIDPETLVLRGSPRRVVRFRRGLLIGVSAVGALSIIAVTWLALQPAGLRLAGQAEHLVDTDRKAPPESLSALPGSYGQVGKGVPDLGPPLPGDLGRPILAHQRKLEDGDLLAGSSSSGAHARQEAAERQQEAELRAVREASVLVQLASGKGTGSSGDFGAQDGSNTVVGESKPGKETPQGQPRLQGPFSPWQLNAGTVIAATLLTGINSDLPGLVTAQVTENVSDSATGRAVLIPQGARLIGRYDTGIAFGQSRALVIWERLIFPNGASIELDETPASDTAGHAGLKDRVNNHTGRLLKGIALATLLGVGAELSLGAESEIVEALREAGQQTANQAGQQIVSKNLATKPTITVRPGWPLRVVLHRELVLQPWRAE